MKINNVKVMPAKYAIEFADGSVSRNSFRTESEASSALSFLISSVQPKKAVRVIGLMPAR